MLTRWLTRDAHLYPKTNLARTRCRRTELTTSGPTEPHANKTAKSRSQSRSQDGSEGFLRPSIPVNGGIRFHPDHSMDETFLNDSTDHMKSR